MPGNNPPEVLVALTREQAESLRATCQSNITAGLGVLTLLTRESAEKMVALIEEFKAIDAAVKKGLEE